MSDTRPSVKELVAAAISGDLVSYRTEHREAIEPGKLTNLILENSEEPEMYFIQFFFEKDEPGYCTTNVSDNVIDNFIWRHDMEEAYQLMRTWAGMRASGMVQLAPMEVEPGTSVIAYPEMLWGLAL